MIAAIIVSVLYVVGLLALNKISKVKYTDIVKSTKNIRNGLFIPVAIGSIVLSLFLIVTGQYTEVFTAGFAIDVSWLWIIPAAIALAGVIRMTHAQWKEFEPSGVLYLFLGALLVGYSEELLVRGYVVTRLVDLDYSVIVIGLISSVIFGVLHFVNYFTGQDIKTTSVQVCTTILFGLDFFILFGLSGMLLLPILLHFFHDFSLLIQGGTVNVKGKKHKTDNVEAGLMIGALALPILALFFI